ncbi:Jag N-terminal domain-containing protein [Sulfurospirillum deleyianum]|uniref:RNA-binding protein KhpB N-terminal domain-containing protein n=1 Tax=Sulfurospirillum deleyianum (strain ATCC 51133 / DSM 6946 / 5175) TaxID=525898 RepID=D1B2U1_SULD5|nr:Jag N-terminal domain-containing protein [Sulfurospirillum deleyianum]ACZ12411.1 conserved hypothetical protein [Sulfurospirillum deleyianum DSM 6946]
MIRIEASTLQEAYSKAARELSCSVVELDINIIQNGSNGFLGLFKKNAIIEVQRKGAHKKREERDEKISTPTSKESLQHVSMETVSNEERKERHKRSKNRRPKHKNRESLNEVSEKSEELVTPVVMEEMVVKNEIIAQEVKNSFKETKHTLSPTVVDQNFHHEKRSISDVVEEVSLQIKHLFQYSCFTLESPIVSKYNEDTILIEFSGEDAALLIGKEGYRYKALSYLLYNWINIKHGMNIRLEIAEFLKNQEEMIEKYLIPVIERIRTSGKGQTKILDGVLIKIALEVLRAEFPEKYVGIKSGKDGGKFIVVNDFNRKNA